MAKISVIFGTYNQLDILKRVLDAYELQTLNSNLFEVVVVDSSSSDGTGQFISSYSPAYNFKGIVQKNEGKSSARNRAIQESSGDIILITDADMIPHKDFVKAHYEAQTQTDTSTCFEGVTYDMTHLHWPINPSYLMPYIKEKKRHMAGLGFWYFLTGNVSIPKALFLEEKGFNPKFSGYGWEDLELGYRLSKKKIPLFYLKNAMNYHYHVITKQEDIERHYKKGESAKVFLALHPNLKWFLGLNPISRFVFPKIKENGWFYRCMVDWFKGTDKGMKHSFGFWFLKEHTYLKGLMSF